MHKGNRSEKKLMGLQFSILERKDSNLGPENLHLKKGSDSSLPCGIWSKLFSSPGPLSKIFKVNISIQALLVLQKCT